MKPQSTYGIKVIFPNLATKITCPGYSLTDRGYESWSYIGGHVDEFADINDAYRHLQLLQHDESKLFYFLVEELPPMF